MTRPIDSMERLEVGEMLYSLLDEWVSIKGWDARASIDLRVRSPGIDGTVLHRPSSAWQVDHFIDALSRRGLKIVRDD